MEEKNEINTLEQNNKACSDIIFSYRTAPCCGCILFMKFYTLVISSDFTIKEIVTDGQKQVVSEKISNVDLKFTEEVKMIIHKYWNQLENIPNTLNNGTLDGDSDKFQFLNKTISSFSIQKVDIDVIKKNNLSYYQNYKETIYHENLVLQVYEEILRLFDKYNITIEGRWYRPI